MKKHNDVPKLTSLQRFFWLALHKNTTKRSKYKIMKDLVLLIWGMLLASGWWAIGIFGTPVGTVMIPVTMVTIVGTLGIIIYVSNLIAKNWE